MKHIVHLTRYWGGVPQNWIYLEKPPVPVLGGFKGMKWLHNTHSQDDVS